MDNNKKKNSIRKLFLSLFHKNGLESFDYIDGNVWFLKNKNKNENFDIYKEILTSYFSENDDIIKFLIKKIISRMNIQTQFAKIKVEEFVNELVEILFNLNEENKRVDNLIKLYDAYKTKNIIEQILENTEKLFKNNQDIFKSNAKVSIEEIKEIPKGDYKISLLASFVNTNVSEKLSMIDEMENVLREEVFEYKLNTLVKIKDNKFQSDILTDYIFPSIDFYSYELKNKLNKFDSGTNFLYFFLKVENLNNIYLDDDIVYSDKKTVIELFLSNLEIFINGINRNKNISTEMSIRNKKYDFQIKLRVNFEFDPWTISSIYSKIHGLLQTTISYKVLTEHKLNTIMFYFDEISEDIVEIFKDEKQNEKGDCLIF